MNFLDLSILNKQTWTIKLPDGRFIHINKPSQKMVIKITNLGTLSTGLQNSLNKIEKDNKIQNKKGFLESFQKQQLEVTNLTFECTLDILNSNTEEIKFDYDFLEVNNFDIETCGIIIAEYLDFITEVQSNPNS